MPLSPSLSMNQWLNCGAEEVFNRRLRASGWVPTRTGGQIKFSVLLAERMEPVMGALWTEKVELFKDQAMEHIND